MRLISLTLAATFFICSVHASAEASRQDADALKPQLTAQGLKRTGRVATGKSLAPETVDRAEILERKDGKALLAYPIRSANGQDWLLVASNELLVTLKSPQDVTAVRTALGRSESALTIVDEIPGRYVLHIRATAQTALTPGEVLERLIAATGITPLSAEPLQQGTANDAQDRQYIRDVQPSAHHNRGGGFGTPDADIDGNEALSRMTYATTYGPSYRYPVIMVIDSGVDIAHPGLSQNIWRNDQETAGDRIDNDGNGYVDDINGWNFFGNNADVGPIGDHGTHVAGIIVGKGVPNRPAIRGLALRGRVMVGKVRVEEGNGLVQVIKALDYAKRQNASIINMSFGFKATSPELNRVIAELFAQDAIMVASAGNTKPGEAQVDLRKTPQYPCMHAYVICVAASDGNDKLSSYSYYGAAFGELGQAGVAIAAPGDQVMSTIPGGGYDFKSGTSMAAPMVTGALAAAWTVHPNATSFEIRNRVIQGSDTVGGLTIEQVEKSRRLNAYRAIFGRGTFDGAAGGYCNERVTDPQTGQSWSRSQQHPFANSGDPGVDGVSLAGAFTICTTAQLVNIQDDMLDRVFVLKQDIAWKSDVSGASSYAIGGRSAQPKPFNGILDGGGYAIDGLDQGRPANAGLIAWLGPRGHVFNMRLTNVRLKAVSVAAAVAIRNDGGRIFNVQAAGSVEGGSGAGGLVGGMTGGEVRFSTFEGTVTGTARVGGLVAQMTGDTSRIENSVFVGQVSGLAEVGGIAGYLGYSARISASHAAVEMPQYATSRDMAGGIAGHMVCRARIANSFAEGSVRASARGGALVGRMTNADIDHAYGAVFISNDLPTTGGAVGELKDGIKIDQTNYMCSNSPAKPAISTRVKDYFDSFQGMTGTGTPMTQAQLRDPANFTTWDTTIWDKASGFFPVLKNLPRSTHPDH